MDSSALSYEKDIRPLFTATDQAHMSFMFDLWSYEEVKSNATEIYDAVSNQTMPPPPEGPWSQAQVDTFKNWMDDGFQP
jgi:tyrosinase